MCAAIMHAGPVHRTNQKRLPSGVTNARARSATDVGKLMAAALFRAWCTPPAPLHLSPSALAAITTRLLQTGAGGLVWWRVRQSELRDSPLVSAFHQAYRLQLLQAELHKKRIQQVVTRLSSAGVDPLLSKGWGAAGYYESGLRPFGDIDLYIRPEEHAAALAAIADGIEPGCPVDLHCGFPDLEDRTLEQLHARSRFIRVGGVEVRVPGPEDQLRHLCLHLLRHGAWRPLWLCDIGAIVERLPNDFDWDYCLSGKPRRSDWVACAIGLAHQILGARSEYAPVADRAKRLPSWFVPAVLRQWGRPYRRYTDTMSISAYLRQRKGFLQAVVNRWPNPIEATVQMRGPFNEVPRLPFQVADCFVRLLHLAKSVMRSMGRMMAWYFCMPT